MARSKDKGYAPIKPPKKSGHHVEGNLTIAPSDLAKEMVDMITPILSVAKAFPTWLLAPLPRFLKAKCCAKASHMPGYDPATYGPSTLATLDSARALIKGQLSSDHDKVRVTNVAKSLAGVDGKDVSHWGHDPIFPLDSGYKAVLNRILGEIRSGQASNRRSGSSAEGPPPKRHCHSNRG